MNVNLIQNAIVRGCKNLNDESKLCFGAAVGCLVVGTGGWLVNLAVPESTLLHGLLIVAGFYGVLGVAKMFTRSASVIEQPSIQCDHESIDEKRVEYTQLRSAA